MMMGKKHNENKMIPVNGYCRHLMASYQIQLHDGVQIRFTSTVPDQYMVYADEDSFACIVRRMLTDAVSATREGSIDVCVTDKGAPGMLTVSVTDTGPTGREPDARLTAIAMRRLHGFFFMDPYYKLGTRVLLNITMNR